ncbi:MAG TPA: ACT domain-containing protein [Thermoanaerobaculaceae bacterium]|nr:ACT domain-containing protein [Thermoanaerobaculaceae bacterium]HPS77326.1 ACT domain-containing protein [Thermoanaerobaculaceae bacterium]
MLGSSPPGAQPLKGTGIIECRGLVAVRVRLAADQCTVACAVLQALATRRINTQLVVQQGDADGHIHVFFCIQQGDEASTMSILAELLSSSPGATSSAETGVAVLAVHGPHFRERAGCAAAACSALTGAGVRVLAISTSVSSVACVVPVGSLPVAVRALQAAFDVSPSAVMIAADGLSRPAG